MRRGAGARGAVLAAGLVVSVFALLLSGCSLSGDTTTTTVPAPATTMAPITTTTEAQTTTTVAAELSWDGTGAWNGISVTAAAPQTDNDPAFVGEGNKVVYCTVKLTNGSKEQFDYNGLDFVMFDSAHQEYDNAGLTSMPDLGQGSLAPGESVQGAVAFELPLAAAPSGLEWQPESAGTPNLIWGQT